MTYFLYTTTTLFIIVCILLVLLVLIQKGRGGGLASAFGGVGGHTAFGSKTGDVLTWATAILFGVFLLLAVGANLVFERYNAKVLAGRGQTTTPANVQNVLPQDGEPVTPGGEGSSLPSAPVTADPGVANPPTVPPAESPQLPPDQGMGAPGPTTRP